MKLTITTLTDLVFSLEVSDDMELENFKVLCSIESNIELSRIVAFFNGAPLSDPKKSMSSYGIKDGDMILIQENGQPGGGGAPSTPSVTQEYSEAALRSQLEIEIRKLFDELTSDPGRVRNLRLTNPELADSFDKGFEEFRRVLSKLQEARMKEEQARIRMMYADPFDAEAQSMIAEQIRLEQIESNMQNALEYLPESFAEVKMLYIKCRVNGVDLKAFVDSGAQSTIMSKACAERCNVLHLIDGRYSGIARGVGTQKIFGKIHLVQLEINGDFLPSSFMILERQPMDMLLGLDLLRRYQCKIDLQKNVLHIGTTGTETTFLSDSEVPKFKLEDQEIALAKLLSGIGNKKANTAGTSASTSAKNTQGNILLLFVLFCFHILFMNYLVCLHFKLKFDLL